MAQQDPWAWANQPTGSPLGNVIQVQPTPEMQPVPQQPSQLTPVITKFAEATPAMYQAGKTAYLGAATPSAPLAANAIPMAGATTTMGAAPAIITGAEVAAPLAAAVPAAIAGTEAATAAALGATAAAPAAGGVMAGMGAAAPAALGALGPAALIPLGLFAAHQATKGK
jgi:hypothetical protein